MHFEKGMEEVVHFEKGIEGVVYTGRDIEEELHAEKDTEELLHIGSILQCTALHSCCQLIYSNNYPTFALCESKHRLHKEPK